MFLLDYYLDETGVQILDFMHKECDCETDNVSKVIIIRQYMCCNNGFWYDGCQFVTFLFIDFQPRYVLKFEQIYLSKPTH